MHITEVRYISYFFRCGLYDKLPKPQAVCPDIVELIQNNIGNISSIASVHNVSQELNQIRSYIFFFFKKKGSSFF